MSAEMFDYSMFAGLDGADGAAIIALLLVYLVIMLFGMIWSIVVYVLQSLGMYTIAKRRGIHHPWLAWLPVANVWILGSISDQYQFVAKGKVRSRRKVLLGLEIAMYALLVVFLVLAFMVIFSAIQMENGNVEAIAGPMILYGVCGFVMWILAIVVTVFLYIVYYDLFASCNPNNAVLFLVLSIFFTFLLPFFVFANRKKDEGMPPRKVQVPVAPWQPAPPPPVPVWQNPAQNVQPSVYQPPVQPPVYQQSVDVPAAEAEKEITETE